MDKIIMLGTGAGATTNLYNTCFVIQNENGNFLVDTGGSVELVKRLSEVGIDFKTINNIFISHSHMDHLLGLIWFFKKSFIKIKEGKIKDKISIYCNDLVYKAIKGVSSYVLPDKLLDLVYSIIDFKILKDNDKYNINGIDYTFFDILGRGTKQYGFKCTLNNKKLVFLGDETINELLYDGIKNYDYVMHEAMCLDSEENIFHAYEKHHSTAKSVAIKMNKLGIKNLILYHTEDTHKNKKELYTKEAQDYFDGNVIVPNDLETIIIR